MGERYYGVETRPDGSKDFSRAAFIVESTLQSAEGVQSEIALKGIKHEHREMISGLSPEDKEIHDKETEKAETQIRDILKGSETSDENWTQGAIYLLKEEFYISAQVEDGTSDEQALESVRELKEKFFEKIFPDVKDQRALNRMDLSPFLVDLDAKGNVIRLSDVEIAKRIAQNPEGVYAQVAKTLQEGVRALDMYFEDKDKTSEDAQKIKDIIRGQAALKILGIKTQESRQLEEARETIKNTPDSPFSQKDQPLSSHEYAPLPPIKKTPRKSEQEARETIKNTPDSPFYQKAQPLSGHEYAPLPPIKKTPRKSEQEARVDTLKQDFEFETIRITGRLENFSVQQIETKVLPSLEKSLSEREAALERVRKNPGRHFSSGEDIELALGTTQKDIENLANYIKRRKELEAGKY